MDDIRRTATRRTLRHGGIILIAAAVLSCTAAFANAADVNSANAVMPGCREFTDTNSTKERWGQPYCAGLVTGLSYLSDACAPPEVTRAQVVRVVVQYIDNRPARMHEDFRKLALEAMMAAWPCRR